MEREAAERMQKMAPDLEKLRKLWLELDRELTPVQQVGKVPPTNRRKGEGIYP